MYQVSFSDAAISHLQALTAREQRIVIDAIEDQLTYQANVPTRNRQPLRPNDIATWKLRVGNFRGYYDIQEVPDLMVHILAIGIKDRNQIRIGDRYLEL